MLVVCPHGAGHHFLQACMENRCVLVARECVCKGLLQAKVEVPETSTFNPPVKANGGL
jgi:hypothetical protein